MGFSPNLRFAPDRPKVNKPLDQLTREELLSASARSQLGDLPDFFGPFAIGE
jgi:hypothetical protein